MNHPKPEAYDPSTPRLDYDEVATAVHNLPDGALAILLQGPRPGEGNCNACEVLRPLCDCDVAEAELLMDWHTDLSTSDRSTGIIDKWVKNPHAHDFLFAEAEEMLGSISYARACTIYALARVEFMERGKPGYPEEE